MMLLMFANLNSVVNRVKHKQCVTRHSARNVSHKRKQKCVGARTAPYLHRRRTETMPGGSTAIHSELVGIRDGRWTKGTSKALREEHFRTCQSNVLKNGRKPRHGEEEKRSGWTLHEYR